jgi:hypothetical protein
MVVTKAQAKAFLGVTDGQLVKIGEYLDGVSPQVDGDGEPVPNSLNDLRDHIVAHYIQLYVGWKRLQKPDPEF